MPKLTEQPILIEVESSSALTPKQLTEMEQKLKKLLNVRKIHFDLKVNPKLIQGISVKVGSVMIDTSISGMLNQFEAKLKKTPIKSMDIDKIATHFHEQIQNLTPTPNVVEIGTVLSVSDGVAHVNGLKNIAMGERVQFASHQEGIVLNLNPDTVDIMIFNDDNSILEGERVYRTGKMNLVPAGMNLLGRVVNALGQPIDGKPEPVADAYMPINAPAPGIIDRDKVNHPVQTGIKGIDALVPIGRGQRELIIGDRQTGKTALIIDTILAQKAYNDTDRKSVV